MTLRLYRKYQSSGVFFPLKILTFVLILFLRILRNRIYRITESWKQNNQNFPCFPNSPYFYSILLSWIKLNISISQISQGWLTIGASNCSVQVLLSPFFHHTVEQKTCFMQISGNSFIALIVLMGYHKLVIYQSFYLVYVLVTISVLWSCNFTVLLIFKCTG